MAEIEWRWADPQGQQRLVRTDELRAALANGVIPPNAPVWKPGWKEWQPAHDVPELTTSALAAVNGVVPNIPPPPLFVVAAQTAFESTPAPPPAKGAVEPPPPPRYVPAATRQAPPPPASRPSRNPSPPKTRAAPQAPPSSPQTPPMPMPVVSRAPASIKTPISQRMSATEALKRSVPTSQRPPPPVPQPTDTQPDISARENDKTSKSNKSGTKSPPAGATKNIATVVGVPRIGDPRGTTSSPPKPAEPARPGRSTLLFDGSAPTETLPPRASSAPPIVAPGTGGKVEKNAVTRPPPVDPGTVRAYGAEPRDKFDSAEEISGSMLIEQTDAGLKIDRPPPPAPSLKASKPPPPGLRALASGSTKVVSRPPAPPIDGYPSAAPNAGTLVGMPDPPTAVDPILHNDPPTRTDPARASNAAAPAKAPGNVQHTPPMQLVVKAPQPAAEPAPAAAPPGKQLSPPTLLGMGPIPSPGPPPADLMEQVGEAPSPRGPRESEAETIAIQRAPEWLEKILVRFPQLRPLQIGKPVFFLPVVGGVAALVALIFFGLLIKGCVSLFSSDKDKPKKNRYAETAPVDSAREPEANPDTTAEPAQPGAPKPSGVTCRLGDGAPKVLAPKALVTSGVETVPLGRSIGVGFAISAKEGSALEVDAVTLNTISTARVKGNELRRVTPVLDRGRVFAAGDVDKVGEKVSFGRTVPGASPFELGVANNQLAWVPRGGAAVTPLWPLEGDAPVEALRAAPDGAGFAVTFRRGASVFSGSLSSSMKAIGPLQETRGLGTQVGAPTIAASGGAVLLMWADRASASEGWSLRMRRSAPNAALGEPHPFTPSGGPGAPFIAPSAIGLGGARFLVVWTEGSGQNHQVRASTIDENGDAIGSPIAISPTGVNAGQAQVALMPDGRGVVAYLASNALGYEVHAQSIICAP